MYIISVIVFIAAFLLFQIEFIVAKVMLPHFGGVYSVWGATMVFFQATLFLGYLFSHLALRKWGIYRYRYIHLGLLALTFLFFPGRALPAPEALFGIPMVLNIFWFLSMAVGLAFFFLSTTSIIFQNWLASSELEEKANPYILYAVSNLGSFAALITYPFIFELYWDLNDQLRIWRIGYFALALLYLAALALIKVRKTAVAKDEDLPVRVSRRDAVKWFLLGAAGVIMFLSVTNILTCDIAPMPLLWMLPLAIYLGSFILVFKKNYWCPVWIRSQIHIILALSTIVYFLTVTMFFETSITLPAYLVLLFLVCMFCQSELYQSKPRDNRNLTSFYLILSLGGFLGGVFVSWLIPLIASSTIEFLAGLVLIALAMTLDRPKLSFPKRDVLLALGLLALLVVWPMIFGGYNISGVVVLIAICWVFSRFKDKPAMLSAILLLLLAMSASPLIDYLWSDHNIIYRSRNYYGVNKIYQDKDKILLLSGNTIHGGQYLAKEKELIPIAYYHAAAPLSQVLISPLFNPDKIGLIGLGAGVLASYGKAGQTMDFFEINPEIIAIAKERFTYLKNCAARTEIIAGDGRMSIRQSPENYYNLIVIDAFSGDYVPVHLITTEALNEYKKRLAPKGVIFFHISSRYLELDPVLFANARAVGAYACKAVNTATDNVLATSYLALTWDKEVFGLLTGRLDWSPAQPEQYQNVKPWTDQYSNLLSAITKQTWIIAALILFQLVIALYLLSLAGVR
ncbi:MAG: fused MFS/spermidine synthase [Planctomycetota bacterium]